jgi:hypothetical protein
VSVAGTILGSLLTSSGNANVVATVNAGAVSATGNVTGNFFIGNGSLLTGIVSSYGNANVAANLAAFANNPILTTGNITGGNILGNGSGLSSITGANVTGTVANATFATSAGTATTAGTVTTAAQANITSVGTLTSLSVTGNITTAANFVGNGAALTGIVSNYGNANVAANLAAFANNPISTTGNITGGNIIGNGSALSAITGANVSGTVANATFATSASTAGTVTANAQANITSVGVLTSLSSTGDVTGGNLLATAGFVKATTGNLSLYANTGSNVNILAPVGGANLSVNGNITGSYFLGNGSALTGITATTANAASFLIDPTAPGVNLSISNASSSLNFPQGGLITWAGDGFDPNTGGSLELIPGGNIANAYVSLTFANTANFAANPISTVNVSNVGMVFKYDFLGGFGGTKTLLLDSTGMSLDTTFSATGNVNAGNLRTGGQVSATGTVTGGNLATGGTASATGNITGGNILTGGLISSTGNITGGNLTGVSGSVATGIINYKDYVATITYASTITPNIALGSIQQVTLTGNVTMNAFGGTPQAGQSMVIKFIQDGTGGRTLTSTMKWAGGLKTLTATANAVDIASVFYDGTTYYASLTNNYS